MTATFGGILRDVVSGEPGVLLRRDIYVAAALVGASAHVLLVKSGQEVPLAAGVGSLACVVIRGDRFRLEPLPPPSPRRPSHTDAG